MLGPRLQHQKSTKILINRFESLGDHRPPPPAAITPCKAPLCPPKQPAVSKKDKSPIRQSFRNLLAVLKKGSGLRGGRSKLESIKTISRSPPRLETCLPIPLSPGDPFTVSTISLPSDQSAGLIFYLSRLPETAPVWTLCSASLETDTLHLTWPTTGTSSTHSILLKHCTDVRSLTSKQLGPEETGLFPEDADLKVFEMVFDDRAGPERLATTSIRERARWVSAIWDVVLPSAGGLSAQPETPWSSAANIDACNSPAPSTICSSSLERALPPVPDSPTTPTRATSPRMLVSPSLYTPTRSNSRLPPVPDSPETPTRAPSPRMLNSPSLYTPTRSNSRASAYSRTRSPSIANLGHLSVVKQRLAQIERNQSTTSSLSPLNSPVGRPRSLRIQTRSYDDAPEPVSPTSILESYGEPRSALKSEVSSGVDQVQDGHGVKNTPSDADPSLAILSDIHQIVSGVAQRNKATENTLHSIQDRLGPHTKSDTEFADITQALGDIDERIRFDLSNILAEVRAYRGEESKAISKVDQKSSCHLDKLDEILNLLKEDRLQRSVQVNQQTDSVRYLNELNSWLEAFVSGGTAQVQVVAAGVEKLCLELGCSEEKNGGASVIAAIRHLIHDGHAREQSASELQLSINSIAALITSESRSGFTTQSVADLIDQQRQDQEGLLRALTAELSNEIRGERLRFVDAMKEATAINVQMHVEQLKAELAREVRADLFAFYSKQKPHGAPLPRPMYAPQSRMAPPPRVLPNRYAAYP